MADPFERNQAPGRRLGGLLRGRRAEVFAAIEDLLAQAPHVRDVGPDVVWGVCAARGVDLRRRYAAERARFYQRYLEHCFADKTLTDVETAELMHLRTMMHLGPDDVAKVHDAVARQVYGEALDKVLEDLEVDPDENAFLRALREELQLPDAEAERLFTERQWVARNRAFTEATARDERFVEHRPSAGEFVGRSAESLDAAIQDGLAKAVKGIPRLQWFEVTSTSGYVEDGQVTGWHVVLTAGVAPEDRIRED